MEVLDVMRAAGVETVRLYLGTLGLDWSEGTAAGRLTKSGGKR